MDDLQRRLFCEVFEALPRQGPGDRASTARALALCRGLPAAPAVLDLGCGTGAQTLDLAELLPCSAIVAVDLHAPSVARLRATCAARGLARRVRPLVSDIGRPGLRSGAFDLVWSEGALYNVGLAPALEVCRDLLRPGGCLAFTEAVWRADDPPAEVRAAFADYPTMGRVPDALRAIEASGLAPVGHFTLPDEAWWRDFYGPMLGRIESLRGAYAHDRAALAALDALAAEPALHRRYGSTYAYEFFVARA